MPKEMCCVFAARPDMASRHGCPPAPLAYLTRLFKCRLQVLYAGGCMRSVTTIGRAGGRGTGISPLRQGSGCILVIGRGRQEHVVVALIHAPTGLATTLPLLHGSGCAVWKASAGSGGSSPMQQQPWHLAALLQRSLQPCSGVVSVALALPKAVSQF